jgi:hypothetical protein
MPGKLLPALLVVLLFPILSCADVALMLHEAIGVSGEETAAGHCSVYFSNICGDGPTRLRLCNPGERGVVISAYPQFGTDKPYEWLALPLLPYLYGVENERDIPLYANGEIRRLLRNTIRRKYFQNIVAEPADGATPLGRWTEVIGTVLNRDIYAFTLRTTVNEDIALIEKYNSLPNETRFSTLYHNCADFAREVVNTYFPHAARRDVLNDFTMTTPKAISKSLTRYATRRPERLFHITKYSQLSGTIRRSLENRKFSEQAIKSKKYLIPQIILKQSLLAIFAASYYTTGQFDPYGTYKKYATPGIAQMNLEASQVQPQPRSQQPGVNVYINHFVPPETPEPSLSKAKLEERKAAERFPLFGSKQAWDKYRSDLAPMLRQAIADKLFADEKEIQTFYKDLELQSEPYFDSHGQLMLRVCAYGQDKLLGLTRENILSDESDEELAYKLMLAKLNAELKAKEKNREPFYVFEQNWTLLHELASRYAEKSASAPQTRPRFSEKPEVVTFKQKFKKFFVLITH